MKNLKNLKERREIEDNFYNDREVEYKGPKGWRLMLGSLDRDEREKFLFDWSEFDYRIKPKYRPWTKEEFSQHLNCWFKLDTYLRKCSSVSPHGSAFLGTEWYIEGTF